MIGHIKTGTHYSQGMYHIFAIITIRSCLLYLSSIDLKWILLTEQNKLKSSRIRRIYTRITREVQIKSVPKDPYKTGEGRGWVARHLQFIRKITIYTIMVSISE